LWCEQNCVQKQRVVLLTIQLWRILIGVPTMWHLRRKTRTLNLESDAELWHKCSFREDRHGYHWTLFKSQKGNSYLLIAMDYFVRWPEVYTNSNQEASTAVSMLVTKFFCHFGAPGEHCSYQGLNFNSWLLQVLRRLGVCKTKNYSLHLPSEGMAEVSGWASEGSCYDATEKLGWEATLQAECKPSRQLEQSMPMWHLGRSYMCSATFCLWLLP
jgi:hypothetical protein